MERNLTWLSLSPVKTLTSVRESTNLSIISYVVTVKAGRQLLRIIRNRRFKSSRFTLKRESEVLRLLHYIIIRLRMLILNVFSLSAVLRGKPWPSQLSCFIAICRGFGIFRRFHFSQVILIRLDRSKWNVSAKDRLPAWGSIHDSIVISWFI